MKLSVPRLQRSLVACALASGLFVFGGCASSPSSSKLMPPTYADLMAAAEDAHRKGGVVEAMGLYEKAARADPSKKQPWARMAQAQFDARNYGAAIANAQEVLLRDTTDITAKSIMAVSGLRVSASALEQLRMANALGGSTREEAQTLARIMREALGESILPPAASTGTAAAPAAAAAAAAADPRASARPVVRKASPVPAAASAPPAPEPKRNPFDALKG